MESGRHGGARIAVTALVAGLLGSALGAGAVAWSLGAVPGGKPAPQAQTESASRTKTTIVTDPESTSLSQAVAEKAVPSVVNVVVYATSVNPWTGQKVTAQAGNGSGVIIREDGYIITNNHVVEGASRIVVTVGTEDKEAKLVGTDPTTDIAVLKIEGDGYHAIEKADSSAVEVGQYVMAIGSPFGLEKSVTVGVVSALGRSSVVDGTYSSAAYVNLIQTDAAVNPGNSGGALVDQQARLIGINTLIQSTSGDSAGIGFAIPIDLASDIAEQLITEGRATHPYLGVSTQTITGADAQQYGLSVDAGAYVAYVEPSSPADKAGVKRGDIIVEIADADIENVEDVFTTIRTHKTGEKVDVVVVRDEKSLTLTATLGSDAGK